MRLFRRRKNTVVDNTESIFTTVIDLTKNLPRADYNRLKKAMDLGYDSYQLIRNVKTKDERQVADVDETDKKLSFEEVPPMN